jgi:hypothetical protein
MVKNLADTVKNERGMVLVVAVLILTVVTIIGIAALTTSDTELQISTNEKLLTGQFYVAEAALIDTWENRPTWMTTDFLTDDVDVASYAGSVDTDNDGTIDATVSIFCIQDEDDVVAAANNLPAQPHTDEPPAGSGYSLKYFEIRRYGVTSTSQVGNTRLQTGVYMVFNKF